MVILNLSEIDKQMMEDTALKMKRLIDLYFSLSEPKSVCMLFAILNEYMQSVENIEIIMSEKNEPLSAFPSIKTH